MVSTVKVPKQFESIFEKAEEVVSTFFSKMTRDPSKGIITVAGDRYIMIRGESIFSNLRSSMIKQFGDEVTDLFLYDLAKTIGHGDAERFAEKMNLQNPLEKLSAGPVHFSHSGWAFVDILPDSTPSPDDNYLLVYDHPNTFESELYIKNNEKAPNPTCVFSAGYSAGWCSFSFGIDLDAREISCIARGDAHCRFVMAPSALLDWRVDEYLKTQKKTSTHAGYKK